MSYIDSYTLEETFIGEGQYGCVKQAQSNKNKDLKVCVKILKKEKSFGKHETTQYQATELDICKKMKNNQCENLVQIYDVYDSDEDDDQAYIFMEKCDINLKQLIENMKEKEENFSKEKLVDIITQIAKGYNSLKSEKIIHRDLKPENILCNIRNNELTIKIADFGLSKVFKANSNQNMTKKIGTKYYSAPEISESKSYDDKCDIFSLGVIIFELASLGKYFKSQNIQSLKEQTFSQLYSNEVKQKEIDQDIVKLLDQMIVYEANKRLTWEQLLVLDRKNLIPQPSQIPSSNLNTIEPQIIEPNLQKQEFTNQPQVQDPQIIQQQFYIGNFKQQQQKFTSDNIQQKFPFNQVQPKLYSDKNESNKCLKKQNTLEPNFLYIKQVSTGQQQIQRFGTCGNQQVLSKSFDLNDQKKAQLFKQLEEAQTGQPTQVEQLGSLPQSGKPGQYGQFLFPVSINQGVRLGSYGQFTQPVSLNQGVQPGSQGQFTQPVSLNQGVQPGSQGQFTQPVSLNQGVQPGSQGQFTQPVSIILGEQQGFLEKQGQPTKTEMPFKIQPTFLLKQIPNQTQNNEFKQFKSNIKFQHQNKFNQQQGSDQRFQTTTMKRN